ncbi:hypothetical protein [Streptomyces sp. NRRL S-350]|uniref:hypothetical protein n=1 Tax=Streptomyces sp. NRRL S-350 TaxID=1463902 RepID=UPI0004BFFFC5|nr:hypothetical protein [Streptomyces sp. NRRL S-350]
MTGRIPLDDLTSDQLDELYDRLESAEAAAACTRHAMPLLRQALGDLPAACRYHGARLDPDRFAWGREACCDTGVPSRRRREAEAALDVLAQAVEPVRRTGPSAATISARGQDPRQPAWDAVFAMIGTLPRDASGAVHGVARNSLIWHAVDAALVALGYQSSYAKPPRPDTAADSVRTAGHAPGGHARALPATRADTVRTQRRDNGALRLPFRHRPTAVRVTVLGTDGSPTTALVVHLPEPDPFTTPETDPWATAGRVVTRAPADAFTRPAPTAGDMTVVLDIALPVDDGLRLLDMCTVPGADYPPKMRMVSVELWAPAELPGEWVHATFGGLSGPSGPEIDDDLMRFQCSAPVGPRTGPLTTVAAAIPSATDTRPDTGHATGGHVRSLPVIGEGGTGCTFPTRADTARTPPGQPCPDAGPDCPDTCRPDTADNRCPDTGGHGGGQCPDIVINTSGLEDETRRRQLAAAFAAALEIPVDLIAGPTEAVPPACDPAPAHDAGPSACDTTGGFE